MLPIAAMAMAAMDIIRCDGTGWSNRNELNNYLIDIGVKCRQKTSLSDPTSFSSGSQIVTKIASGTMTRGTRVTLHTWNVETLFRQKLERK